MPVIVRNLTDEQAAIMMVDANLHRENILPSEKDFAYKMKMEAMSRQGNRTDLTSRQVGGESETADLISNTDSGRQVQRYIRLTYLIPELLQKVDEGRIALTPAVEPSYLPENEQAILYDEIQYIDATPNLSQAQRLRLLSKQERLSKDSVFAILSEEKANQKEQVRFMAEDYLQVGYYTDTFFPDRNIRFIAVNDYVDSNDGENEFAPLRNVMNGMYARDISRKVRSSHRLRGNAGEPLS